MRNFHHRRPILALAALPLALLLGAAPAAAWIPNEDGDTGLATVNEPAKCRYENNPGELDDELDRIVIPQVWSHAASDSNAKVGYQYIIKRDAPPYGTYVTYHKSSLIKKTANGSEVAFFGPYTYNVPENTNARWRVIIVFYYYAVGDPNDRVGSTRGAMEVYRHKVNGSPAYNVGEEGVSKGYCRNEFH